MIRAFSALGLAVLVTTSAGSAVNSAALYTGAGPGDDAPVMLTLDDINASNAKAGAAFSALATMWSGEFDRIGERFTVPRLVRYRGAVNTRCGVMAPSNASYCYNSNTIYFDDVFVATQAKLAGTELGTDGDMTAIGIIAHEMGHAVAMQLGFHARDSYGNEAVADCLAGAFTRQAGTDGSLEDGDIDEAFFGMKAAGDPTPEYTGNARMDRRIQRALARGAHGTPEQRLANFKNGLEHGPSGCLDELR